MQIKSHYGNIELLKLSKTAFLCSRQVPASAVLKCYDWATEKRKQSTWVISGFHSQLEKDVLHFLIKGNQPVIMVLARSLTKKVQEDFSKPIADGRLLIISPFDETVSRASENTCQIRNRYMLNIADKITIGYARTGGLLSELVKGIEKDVEFLVK
jgi:predicted Rossmann fold nucleotide-binding protein DprA/Smf involved in DNA uptake